MNEHFTCDYCDEFYCPNMDTVENRQNLDLNMIASTEIMHKNYKNRGRILLHNLYIGTLSDTILNIRL